jgi:hypothetical protein
MLQLDLTPDETRVLQQVLEDYLSDLRMEIVDTEDMNFREMLKHKKSVIAKVLEALPLLKT